MPDAPIGATGTGKNGKRKEGNGEKREKWARPQATGKNGPVPKLHACESVATATLSRLSPKLGPYPLAVRPDLPSGSAEPQLGFTRISRGEMGKTGENGPVPTERPHGKMGSSPSYTSPSYMLHRETRSQNNSHEFSNRLLRGIASGG